MNTEDGRTRQPEVTRTELLKAAAGIVAQQGLAGLTLDRAAKRAGVSKGALTHHFPSKRALIEAVLGAVLESFGRKVESFIARDGNSRGRFTRAYVAAIAAPDDDPFETLLDACALEMSRDKKLSLAWRDWLLTRMLAHGEDPGAVSGRIIRYAADGLWLERRLPDVSGADRQAVADRLMKMSLEL